MLRVLLLVSTCLAAPLVPEKDAHSLISNPSNVPVLVSSWTEKSPAVALAYNSSGSYSVVVSTFAAFSNEPLYRVDNVANLKNGEKPNVVVAVQDMVWINFIAPIEDGVFNQSNLLLTAGGFLTPNRQTGHISVIDTGAENWQPIRIDTDKANYFFHKAVLADIDGDGLIDVLGARASVPTIPWNPKKGELVWFRQPESGALNGTAWQEHVLVQGPDVDFIFADITGDGHPEVIATQFFTASQVAVYSCPEEKWSLCNDSNIHVHIIDNQSGPYFAVERADINNDGKLDLLITNNRADGKGSVFVYEIPADPLNDKYTRHQLSTGYTPHSSILPGKGAPGKAASFQPYSDRTGKPLILVSGDDAGTTSVLVPTSEDPNNWDYTEHQFVSSSGTIGSPTFADVDNDGKLEVFVPHYDDGIVEMYAFP